ncbi:MAG: ExbD/TolR family protein [Treponemataceae bacterium]
MKLRKRMINTNLHIDLVPMIDIVFQVVLFFLVSTTFILLPGINITLPQSSTGESVDSTGITLTVSNNGSLWFNNEQIVFENLESVLNAYPLSDEQRQTFPINIEADELVTNGTLIKIFDTLRKTGFPSVNLRTTNTETQALK